jgi:hypothetical protein
LFCRDTLDAMLGSNNGIHTAAPRRFLAVAACLTAGCVLGGPVIPDNTAKVGDDDAATPNDVFLRDPWELWRTPHGPARYHRGTFMLVPDQIESFRLSDVSIYAKDGSDVRFDFQGIGIGSESQVPESISIFIQRASGDAAQEWSSVLDRLRRRHPGGEAAEPFPIPIHYPPSTKQAAFVVRQNDRFFQVSLFRNAGWTVRYEIECQAQDVAATQKSSLAFLREIRYRE